jgi:hypothetical protein
VDFDVIDRYSSGILHWSDTGTRKLECSGTEYELIIDF